MIQTIFVVILRYIVPLEHIDAHRADHLKFLDQQYENDIFIASGRQVPCSGGVILAHADNRAALENILSQDPYFVHRLAEYQIYEFTPTKYHEAFRPLLGTKHQQSAAKKQGERIDCTKTPGPNHDPK